METETHRHQDASNTIQRLCNVLAMLRVVQRSLIQQEFGGDEETTLEITINSLQEVYNLLESETRHV
jgi:hypothetical protein